MEVIHTTTVVASCGRCASEITGITCIPAGIGKYRIILDPCSRCISKRVEEILKDKMCKNANNS